MKQANLGLTIEQLHDRNDWLRSQANKVVKDFTLVDILQTAGKPKIVGSFAMNLMVWPDIDLEVQTVGRPSHVDVLAIAQALIEAGIARLTINDHRQSLHPDMPRGIYLGPDIVHQDISWQVDIWFISQEEVAERSKQITDLLSKLTKDYRDRILLLKQILAAHEAYHRGISSLDIYTAVIEHGVITIEDFSHYLALSGRKL